MKSQIATPISKITNGPSHQPLHSQPHHPQSHYPQSHHAPTTVIPWSISTGTLSGEPLTIRSATAADAAALATVGGKGFAAVHQVAVSPEEMQGVLASAWSEQSMTEMIANPEIQTMVAEIDQQIVGLACLNPTDRPSYLRRPTPVELGRFYLHLDWIGFGLGSKLMAQALRQAAATGYGICWLRVWQGNKSAIHFYRRWGFTTISADYYAIGSTLVPVWVMIHSLAGKEEATGVQ